MSPQRGQTCLSSLASQGQLRDSLAALYCDLHVSCVATLMSLAHLRSAFQVQLNMASLKEVVPELQVLNNFSLL